MYGLHLFLLSGCRYGHWLSHFPLCLIKTHIHSQLLRAQPLRTATEKNTSSGKFNPTTADNSEQTNGNVEFFLR